MSSRRLFTTACVRKVESKRLMALEDAAAHLPFFSEPHFSLHAGSRSQCALAVIGLARKFDAFVQPPIGRPLRMHTGAKP
eukprot:471509-Pyramimonas_sp.AAC.3